jgi:serine/threonine protein kinase
MTFRLVELKTLHASSHKNIVNFYGAFYVDGVLSFILVCRASSYFPTINLKEFMDRGTFFDLLKVRKAIPENYLSRMSFDILSGLEYLHHTLHLIHRYGSNCTLFSSE